MTATDCHARGNLADLRQAGRKLSGMIERGESSKRIRDAVEQMLTAVGCCGARNRYGDCRYTRFKCRVYVDAVQFLYDQFGIDAMNHDGTLTESKVPSVRSSKAAAIGLEAAAKIADRVTSVFALGQTGKPSISDTLRVAQAIDAMRKALPDAELEVIRCLENSELGYLTDKRTGEYSNEIVRNVIIAAILRGYLPINNEFNIIGGKFYATKNGLARKIREFPGLTDYKVRIGVPLSKSGGALVSAVASWKLDGQTGMLDCTNDYAIPVRVNAGMGSDGIRGKAARKLHAMVLDRLTGSNFSDFDEADDAIDVAPVQDPQHLSGENLEAITAGEAVVDATESEDPVVEREDILSEALRAIAGAKDVGHLNALQQVYTDIRSLTDDEREMINMTCTDRRRQLRGA